jgi:hypothetical protein
MELGKFFDPLPEQVVKLARLAIQQAKMVEILSGELDREHKKCSPGRYTDRYLELRDQIRDHRENALMYSEVARMAMKGAKS